MDPFDGFPKSDFEVISPEGEVRGSGKGIFTGRMIAVFDETLLVFAGDEIRRRLPNGADEVFEVIDPTFFGAMDSLPGHFQIDVRRKGSFPHGKGGHMNITVTGDNARVNIGSTDNSTNTVNHGALFADIIAAIERGVPDDQRGVLIEAVRDMERAQGTGGFAGAYQRFVAVAADHFTLVAPFLPALTALL